MTTAFVIKSLLILLAVLTAFLDDFTPWSFAFACLLYLMVRQI